MKDQTKFTNLMENVTALASIMATAIGIPDATEFWLEADKICASQAKRVAHLIADYYGLEEVVGAGKQTATEKPAPKRKAADKAATKTTDENDTPESAEKAPENAAPKKADIGIPEGYKQVQVIESIDPAAYVDASPMEIDEVRTDIFLNSMPNYPKTAGSLAKGKHGVHPFFTGSASYLVYLKPEDRVQFLTGLVAGNCKEYNTTFTTFDLSQINDMIEQGVDPGMMGAMMYLDDKTTIFDLRETLPESSVNTKFAAAMATPEGQAKVLPLLKKIAPDYPWTFFNFMTCQYFTPSVFDILKQIAKAHAESPNPFVGYADKFAVRLKKMESAGVIIPK